MEENQSLITETKSVDDAPEPGFVDWAGMVTIQPKLYYRPQSIEDLKSFLLGIQLGYLPQDAPRVLGGLHSCSNICVSDTIIDSSALPRTIEFDPGNTHVTVTANWHLHDFLQALGERGKSISATGGTDHQTLGGVITTNTAPASAHHLIYDLVEWIEYLTISEDGKSVVEKRVASSEPAFRAVVASLGAIGILTKIRYRLIDQPFYETIQKIIRLKDVLTDLEKTSRTYDFWRIDWVPDTDNGLLWAAKRVDSADPAGDYADDASENVLVAVFKVLDKIEAAGPLLDDAMRLVYAGISLAYGQVKASGPLRTMLPVDRRAPLRVAMAEWSFNPADLDRLMALCRQYYEQHGWPNLPIEIELTKTDNFYMSPWNWPGLDYIVKFNFMYLTDVCQAPGEKDAIYTHLRGLWEALGQAGIPFKAHWGKINFMDHAYVQSHFDLEAFQPFTRPMFLNTYLKERLVPPG
jgi:FAD/FMN-containing dehydrogenase